MIRRPPRSTLFPYTDALPICEHRFDRRTPRRGERLPTEQRAEERDQEHQGGAVQERCHQRGDEDRKSTRLNSSHLVISYAVFCLKKKKKYDSSRAPASAYWRE